VIYLLDTDHVSALQRGGLPAASLVSRLRQLSPDDYGTTVVTYEEQCRGRANVIHQARTGRERLDAYRRLSENLRFFSSLAVWEYTQTAELRFVTLSNLQSGMKDRLIASIALAHEATVLTRNHRDFTKVPTLHVEDWTLNILEDFE
jgi:tRNA(fMet)-specific endonuclease VapC